MSPASNWWSFLHLRRAAIGKGGHTVPWETHIWPRLYQGPLLGQLNSACARMVQVGRWNSVLKQNNNWIVRRPDATWGEVEKEVGNSMTGGRIWHEWHSLVLYSYIDLLIMSQLVSELFSSCFNTKVLRFDWGSRNWVSPHHWSAPLFQTILFYLPKNDTPRIVLFFVSDDSVRILLGRQFAIVNQ
jgi:hypothetical protein